MNLGGSHADVIMDDCRKSQTLDSLPGKAGGLPILITSPMKKNTSNKKFIISILLILLSALIVLSTSIPAYFYARYCEKKFIKRNPQTKAELEKILRFYSLHAIDPKESSWGHLHVFQEGERMMQYRILWRKDTPLDVVYDEHDNIKNIFTSYE